MKHVAGLLAAITLAGCAVPSARGGSKPVALTMAPAGVAMTEDEADRVLHEILEPSGFRGFIAYSAAPESYSIIDVGTRLPRGSLGEGPPWPWASMTKQVVAVMVMQAVEDGKLALDQPLSTYLPDESARPSPTIRQLLQHRSGLRNPDDSPMDSNDWPSFYTSGSTGPAWCMTDRRTPPAEGWRYNNCDYIALGAVLEKVTGMTLAALFQERIAKPAGLIATSFADPGAAAAIASPEPIYASIFPRFGAAGGLIGPATDMLRFDRALLDGRLLGAEARKVLWAGDPALGYMGLGQWVFTAPLQGCTAPVQVVERRGAIGKYQVRNIILPERGMAIALVTDLSEQTYDFGEIWTGEGPMHDVLAALACPGSEKLS